MPVYSAEQIAEMALETLDVLARIETRDAGQDAYDAFFWPDEMCDAISALISRAQRDAIEAATARSVGGGGAAGAEAMSPLIARLKELERWTHSDNDVAAAGAGGVLKNAALQSIPELAEALHNALVLVRTLTGADDAIANATLDAGNTALANLARRLGVTEKAEERLASAQKDPPSDITIALRARAAPPADGEVDTIVAAANVTIATFRTHLSEANAALAIERAAGDELEHSVDEWRERATVAETRLRLAEEVAEHLQDCADKLEELGASGYAESARVALAAYTASVKKGDGM